MPSSNGALCLGDNYSHLLTSQKEIIRLYDPPDGSAQPHRKKSLPINWTQIWASSILNCQFIQNTGGRGARNVLEMQSAKCRLRETLEDKGHSFFNTKVQGKKRGGKYLQDLSISFVSRFEQGSRKKIYETIGYWLHIRWHEGNCFKCNCIVLILN